MHHASLHLLNEASQELGCSLFRTSESDLVVYDAEASSGFASSAASAHTGAVVIRLLYDPDTMRPDNQLRLTKRESLEASSVNEVSIGRLSQNAISAVLAHRSNREWIARLYALVARERVDEALDVLFESVEMYLDAERFAECGRALLSIDINRLDTNLLVGLLTATLPAAAELAERPALARRVSARLRHLAPDRHSRLVMGLI